MRIVHVEHIVHSGAETVTDQLAGTIVENVPRGLRGRTNVRIAVVNNTALTAYFSASVGRTEIARKSFCPFKADGATPESAVFHSAEAKEGDKLDLEITVAGASTSCVIVIIESMRG